MEKKWYVLQALSGQEGKARENLEKRIQQEEMQEYVGQVLMPTEKVTEIKNNKKTTVVRKLYPGYVFIELALYDEDGALMEKPWLYIQATPGLIGFVSSDRNRPQPMRQSEVDQMMAQIQDQGDRGIKLKVNFEPGEKVITSGYETYGDSDVLVF